jgi:hypothetical protein
MTRFAISMASVAGTLLAACVDTTPLLDAQPVDGGRAEAGIVAEASVNTACTECVLGDDGPCRPQYDVCAKDTKCKALMDCFIGIGCLTVISLQDRIACADPCLKSAGVVAGSDPALQIGLQLNVCSLDKCKQVCGG